MVDSGIRSKGIPDLLGRICGDLQASLMGWFSNALNRLDTMVNTPPTLSSSNIAPDSHSATFVLCASSSIWFPLSSSSSSSSLTCSAEAVTRARHPLTSRILQRLCGTAIGRTRKSSGQTEGHARRPSDHQCSHLPAFCLTDRTQHANVDRAPPSPLTRVCALTFLCPFSSTISPRWTKPKGRWGICDKSEV